MPCNFSLQTQEPESASNRGGSMSKSCEAMGLLEASTPHKDRSTSAARFSGSSGSRSETGEQSFCSAPNLILAYFDLLSGCPDPLAKSLKILTCKLPEILQHLCWGGLTRKQCNWNPFDDTRKQYIYIYIYAVKLLAGPSLGFFNVTLPSCLFFFLLVPSFCLFLSFCSSLLLFHERNNIKTFNCNFFFHQSVLFFFGFLSRFSFKPLFLIFAFFLILSYVFVQHECFWFQNKQHKNTNVWSRGGLQENVFLFINLCFAKCEKLSFLGGPFSGQILVDVQKTL